MVPTNDLPALRAKAAAHQRTLDAQSRFYTVADLAERWHCSPASVRSIPRARLNFTAIGRGTTRRHRRYDPKDVAAYEQQRGADRGHAGHAA